MTNSTPNYGLNLSICGVDGIDRELKRLEDKLGCKASKCELEKHLVDPHAHQELFDGKVDKKEGCRLICEGELQGIDDALEDRYTRDKVYTQEEVDELLAGKVNVADLEADPQWFNVPLLNGTVLSDTNGPFQYCKVGKTIYLRGAVVFSQTTPYKFAQLPNGFRGTCLTTSIPSSVDTAPATIVIDQNGTLSLLGTYPNMSLDVKTRHHICTSFVTAQ